MKNLNVNKKYFAGAVLMLALAGCGSDSKNSAAQSDVVATSAASDNNYITSADLRTVDANGASGRVIPKGTELTIIESKGDLLHLGVDSDDESLPADVWATMADATASGLEKMPESDIDAADSAVEDLIDVPTSEEVSQDALLQDAGGKVMHSGRHKVVKKYRGKVRRGSGGRIGKGGMTYCFRYVKLYLLKIGAVKSYLPGVSAWSAAGTLPKQGYRSTGAGPSNAQINDVCVYRGGKGGNGHVEVKVKGGWYYGYGIKANPISRYNHPFIGCFRK